MIALAYRSLLNRRFTLLLTVLAIALSVALLLGIERLRQQARDGFTNAVSGTDLIIAARGNDLQILLATVFGIGSTSNTLDWEAFEAIHTMPEVAWAVPISQGDNHKGHPVIGTEAAYFDHFRYGNRQPLRMAQGTVFDAPDEAVVGADVAAQLGYGLGTVIVNAHGAGDVSFDVHDDAPFTITGILAATGTPVDRMVFVPLEGFDRIHEGYGAVPEAADPFAEAAPRAPASDLGAPAKEGQDHAEAEHDAHAHGETGHAEEHAHEDHAEDDHDHADHAETSNDSHANGETGHAEDHAHADHAEDDHDHADHAEAEQEAHAHGETGHADEHAHEGHSEAEHADAEHSDEAHHHHDHEPGAVNAAFVGLTSPTAVLSVQRRINEYAGAPLTAVMPAVSLQGLWQITGVAEDTLRLMSWAVVAAGLIGLVVMLAATLEGRRREFAILRAVGATPGMIMRLILGEALLITTLGICAGILLLYALQAVAAPMLAQQFGLRMGWAFSGRELALVAAVLGAALIASLPPAWRTYRATLADGLTPRL
ncbi:FtsX-like permease family protein [Pseudoruegeria aquimaris]|uniref:FtsX-like permease family protein n=1 Tax=Pseudoruegeria aquimaris TaxID=393663 RepID=A0A1Y5RG94_9RHOB|nr:ABC transporter permease [Pseudoruegeria aquimaris]SLN16524.1 FtsX-like permease family protein [Pseudoruegeria aquimaris]